MRKNFKGEAIYSAETEVHFPQYAEHMRDVVIEMLGLSHTINTGVENDFIR